MGNLQAVFDGIKSGFESYGPALLPLLAGLLGAGVTAWIQGRALRKQVELAHKHQREALELEHKNQLKVLELAHQNQFEVLNRQFKQQADDRLQQFHEADRADRLLVGAYLT